MIFKIDTFRDLREFVNTLDVEPSTGPGTGELQKVRFPNGSALLVVVAEEKFGDVISFEMDGSVDP